MQLSGVKKLLDRVGFGSLFGLEEKIDAISLSEIKKIPLYGNFDLGFALGEYSMFATSSRKRTKLGALLHKFKYEQDRYAGMILSDLLSDFVNSQSLLKSSDMMLTVPPSFISRSFDPVSFLAQRIEERTQIRWEKDALKRTRLTKQQKSVWGLEPKEMNVSDAFRLTKPLALEGKKILLIDDLFASGATLNEISAILREAKADKIHVLVLAKSICPMIRNSCG